MGSPILSLLMSKILDSPPATSTSLRTCDFGAKVPMGGWSYVQVLMRGLGSLVLILFKSNLELKYFYLYW
jgi:hypothetical protein